MLFGVRIEKLQHPGVALNNAFPETGRDRFGGAEEQGGETSARDQDDQSLQRRVQQVAIEVWNGKEIRAYDEPGFPAYNTQTLSHSLEQELLEVVLRFL
jgi:hypothetical protein